MFNLVEKSQKVPKVAAKTQKESKVAEKMPELGHNSKTKSLREKGETN